MSQFMLAMFVGLVAYGGTLSVLHRILQAHLETFLARSRDQHGGLALPLYVQRELRAFLGCGDLARGFVRIRCPACATDLLVACS